jgi:UDP-2-acetamido-3-amino-2,3-dideoxy-glucuronate N-acetyltransferase
MSYVHPSAVVDEGAVLGEGTKVWHFCHVSSGARLGANCVLGQNCFVAGTARLGDGVRVQNNVSIYDGVILEDHVFVGPSAVFTNVINPRSEVARKQEYRQTIVRRGASIGANATIVCGHEIGEYAFIGAGAVVTRPVPAYALVVGAPARAIGWMCRCGERLRLGPSLGCAACGARYELSDGKLSPQLAQR